MTALDSCHLSDAKAVAASGVVRQAILDLGLSRRRSRAWITWWSTIQTPVARAAPGDRALADHTAVDGAPVAPVDVPLLLHSHLRTVAAGWGDQSLTRLSPAREWMPSMAVLEKVNSLVMEAMC